MRAYLGLIFVVLLILCAFYAAVSDVFLTWPNILNIFTASATIGLLAIGATFVIGAGGLDLSVGSLMALSAMAGVLAAGSSPSLFMIVFFCLMTGLFMGALNGALIGGLKLPAFIVTLGMLSIARGLALILSGGHPVYGLPDSVVFLGQGRVGGIPVPVIVFLSAGLFGSLLLSRTRFGRHGLAIGDNEKASRNAGIRIFRHKVALYAFSGLLAATAGLLAMGRVNAADPGAGMMYELTAITAAIIGGTSLSGGRASVPGAMMGALIMGVLQNGMTLMNVPAYYQQLAVGVVLISVVAFGQWRGVHAAAR